MNKKMIERISVIAILLTLMITSCENWSCCNDAASNRGFDVPRGVENYGEIHAYTFDPKTILARLDQKDGLIFEPLSDWGQKNIFPSGTFSWQQHDYLKITNALNQLVNHDNLEGWSLYSMHFSRECADNPIGFDDFSITYFKTMQEQYVTREIEVWSLAKEADVGVNLSFPRKSPDWQNFDLKNFKVTADDVLQIAENNGGKAARQSVKNKNDCFISIWLDDNWIVRYGGGNSAPYFQMSIDPYNRK